jgi:CRISPR-associated protein Cmr3
MNTHELLLRFDPLDSLFFRDGRPYTKGESEQVGVASQFPPTPATLVGALRAAAARELGWSGQGDWDDAIKEHLGDGQSLVPLQCRGPVILQRDRMLYPAPASLVIRTNESRTETGLLRPGPERDSDLGQSIRLPSLPDTLQTGGWKPATDYWLTADGVHAVLRGRAPAPDTLIPEKNLWSKEARVGIAREASTRTTQKGALYSPQHVRLAEDVGLGLWVSGLPEAVIEQIGRKPHPLGGESRSARITSMSDPPSLASMPGDLQGQGSRLCHTVTILTPLPLEEPPRPGGRLPGVPGEIVSACLPRSLRLGGWDSVKRRPLPLKPHLAPGSVLFMQADKAEESAIRAAHGTCIGERPAWGYGLVVIGTWNED